jgi:Domain of unknown function, B. Theta Gene description (DUF3873)
MADKLTKNGISTTLGLGQFAYEEYVSAFTQRKRVQWDYRDRWGKLHSGICDSVEEAKEQVARQFGFVAQP